MSDVKKDAKEVLNVSRSAIAEIVEMGFAAMDKVTGYNVAKNGNGNEKGRGK